MQQASACSMAARPATPQPCTLPFTSGARLLAQCQASGLTMAQVMRANEAQWRSPDEVQTQLRAIWQTMAGPCAAAAQQAEPCPDRCTSAAARPSCSAA